MSELLCYSPPRNASTGSMRAASSAGYSAASNVTTNASNDQDDGVIHRQVRIDALAQQDAVDAHIADVEAIGAEIPHDDAAEHQAR